MTSSWWDELDAARELRDEALDLRGLRDRREAELRAMEERLAEADATLARERKDVERLRGLSWASMVHTLLGDADARLRREEREVVEARFKKEEVEADLVRAKAALADVVRRAEELAVADEAYERALAVAAKRAAREKGPIAKELRELADREGRMRRLERRFHRASEQGEAAHAALARVLAALGGAQRMSVWDLFGGGVVASALKHGRIDAARELLSEARSDLESFRRRLGGLAADVDVELAFDGFVRGADVFVDWMYHDFIVAERLNDAHRRVEGALEGVSDALSTLRARRERVQASLAEARARRRALLERDRPG